MTFIVDIGAKLLCVDAATLVLALSSGVLFGGVWQGALISVTFSSIASLVGFFLSRYKSILRYVNRFKNVSKLFDM